MNSLRLLPASIAFTLVISACKEEPSEKQESVASNWQEAPWETHSENLQSRPFSESDPEGGKRFTRVETVDFQNLLKRENIRNYLTTGAGLAIGDVDQNGLPDLFLVSQDGPNKLFLQTAPWQFEDATTKAGIDDTQSWGAGAAFADIDNDGDLDLYVCNKAANDELYLNQGDGTFKGNLLGSKNPEARAPTMVSFSDFDRDGDLDFYRTETRLWSLNDQFNGKVDMVQDAEGNWQPTPEFAKEFEVLGGAVSELGTFDHLYRNEGPSETGEAQFRDVTRLAGIKIAREHGLAATWWDYNNDNHPDLYISNDFHTPDHLYRNNKDGTFSEVTEDALPYTSWSSMGSDFADINNDGWFDYLSTDMSATTHFKQKTMMGAMVETAWFLDNMEPRQYMRNALQINTGTGKFIDTAFYSGIDSTDWTWGGIFGDLDNDGLEDAFFTNGIERNFQDSDLSIKMRAAYQKGAAREEVQAMLLDSPRFKEKNLVFQNQGDLRFKNRSDDWGLGDLTVSHGAVLADLDRDGDLDVIVNNMNDPVGIYRNNSSGQKAILISLRGKKSNHFGLGARLTLELEDGQTLTRLVSSARGYMSGTEPVTHFGIGDSTIKNLHITWPSGNEQHFTSLTSGRHYQITESEESVKPLPISPTEPFFEVAKDSLGLDFEHRENPHNDFLTQPLLPNKLSRFGPALAVADINGDQLPDVFAGSAKGKRSALYLQKSDGGFQELGSLALEADRGFEDVAATWFDADGDADLDLYVVSGGAAHEAGSEYYQDRLYLNDGSGNLTSTALPEIRSSGSCVASSDIDGDGDFDLFIGARFVPGKYPTPPQSTLLINEGGSFTAIDSPVSDAGMVTGAVWVNLDADGRDDLALSCEWGPVRIFKNKPEGLVEIPSGMENLTGWWTSIAAGDLDHDGDVDLIAGNFGLNTKYHVDPEHPATLFAADFGKNGELQVVEAKLKEGKLLPVRGRSCSTSAMPHLKKRAPSYTAFATLSLDELYTEDALETAQRLEAKTLVTTLFRNDGNGRFTAEPLPMLSQLAPVMSIALDDFNDDGFLDAALGQNFNHPQRETGRMNAGLSVLLTGSKEGTLNELWPAKSGLTLRSDTRQVISADLNHDGKPDLLIGGNAERLKVLLKQ